MVIWTILLAIVAGILYRLGGSVNSNTKFRDLGVPTIATIWLLLFSAWHVWPLVVHFGLLFGALTTYFYFLPNPPDKGPKALNWVLHGFFCGLPALTLIWCGIPWWLILIRALILSATITGWSLVWKWVDVEEWGRGALIILTLIIWK